MALPETLVKKIAQKATGGHITTFEMLKRAFARQQAKS